MRTNAEDYRRKAAWCDLKGYLLNLSATQLRKHAERCKAVATTFSNPDTKADLERVANAWAQLAERLSAIKERKPGD